MVLRAELEILHFAKKVIYIKLGTKDARYCLKYTELLRLYRNYSWHASGKVYDLLSLKKLGLLIKAKMLLRISKKLVMHARDVHLGQYVLKRHWQVKMVYDLEKIYPIDLIFFDGNCAPKIVQMKTFF